MATLLKRMALPLAILALAVGVLATLVATRPQRHAVEVQEKAWPVAVMEVAPARLPRTLPLFGRVDAPSLGRLTAPVAAEVRRIAVMEGQRVKAGDLLLALDERDYRLDLTRREAEVAQAEAAIAAQKSAHRSNLEALPRERRLRELAQAEVKRLEDLLKKNLASHSALDTARQALARQDIAVSRIQEKVRNHQSRMQELEARLAQRRAELEKARLQLERTRIRAPFDGRVLSLKVAVGQRVAPGTLLLELVESRSLVLRVLLPDPYLAEVRRLHAAGEPLRVHGRLDDRPVTAELVTLAAQVPAGGGGVEGLFRLIEGNDWLELGRVLALRLTLPPLDGLVAVPMEALYGDDKLYLVDDDDRLRPLRAERVGQLHRDGVTRLLVRSPRLHAGQRLLVTQLPNAVTGLKVKVVEHE